MGNIAGFNLDINQDFLEEAVKQTVIMGISEALNGKNEITSQIVQMVLNTKVDENGKVQNREYYQKYTLLEFYVSEMLKEETRSALKELVDQKRPEIREIIRKHLSNKNIVNMVTKNFIEAFSENLDMSFYTNIDIDFSPIKKEY